MNIWDVLILAAIAAALFFAFRAARGNRQHCCSNCDSCKKDCCGGCTPRRSPKQEQAHEKTP